MITTEELARIRTAAIGDMLGDSKELDKLGPAATVFRLCRELELLGNTPSPCQKWQPQRGAGKSRHRCPVMFPVKKKWRKCLTA